MHGAAKACAPFDTRQGPTSSQFGQLSPQRVIRVGFVMSAICPVYPKQQTFLGPVGTSHLGHEATFPLVVKAASGGRRSTLPSAVAGHCTRDCKVFLETLDLTSLLRRKLVFHQDQ